MRRITPFSQSRAGVSGRSEDETPVTAVSLLVVDQDGDARNGVARAVHRFITSPAMCGTVSNVLPATRGDQRFGRLVAGVRRVRQGSGKVIAKSSKEILR